MPATEAQKRAQKKWCEKNKERHNELKLKWLNENRDKHNELNRLRMKRKYDVSVEFKIFRRILLE
jgi:hypothetical protein